MRKRIRRYRSRSKVQELFINHIENNIGIYIFLGILFLIGIAFGIFFISNLSEAQETELIEYVCQHIVNFNTVDSSYLKELILENVLLIFIMWIAGITIVGIIIDYIIVIYKGFCIGYTVSAITLSIGAGKALEFVFSGMLLQNLLLIPALIGTAASGMIFLKEILRNKDKESVFVGIIKHTLFSVVFAITAICSALIEIFVSNQLLRTIINYIN